MTSRSPLLVRLRLGFWFVWLGFWFRLDRFAVGVDGPKIDVVDIVATLIGRQRLIAFFRHALPRLREGVFTGATRCVRSLRHALDIVSRRFYGYGGRAARDLL